MGDTFPDGRWSWRPPITGQQTVANNLSGAKPRRRQPAAAGQDTRGREQRIAIRDSSDRCGTRGIRGALSHPKHR